MQSTAHTFNRNVDAALADPNLQDSLAKLKVGFSERRRQAAERLPEFEALRDRARDIKNHTLAHLDFYLEEFERKVIALGGHVHWAPTAADARRIIAELCKSVNARTIAKSKSMVSEEIGLNEHLEKLGRPRRRHPIRMLRIVCIARTAGKRDDDRHLEPLRELHGLAKDVVVGRRGGAIRVQRVAVARQGADRKARIGQHRAVRVRLALVQQ